MASDPVAGAAAVSEEAAIGFVLTLGRALHRFGTPADRLEEALNVVCRRLGLAVELFSSPTTLIASFGRPTELRTRMMRMGPGDLNMAKLTQVDAVADAASTGLMSMGEATARLDAIVAAPATWSRPVATFADGLTAAAVAVFFHGGWRDVLVSGLVGLAVGILGQLMARSKSRSRVFELVGAAVAAFASGAAAALWPGVSASVCTVAGIIVLLPGLTLTVAMTELATRNLISGTARLMSAVIVLFELVVGVAVGERCAQRLFEPPHVLPVPMPSWTEWVALVAAAFAMTIVVQAERRALAWILAASVVGVVGARLGAQLLGPELGALGGAFALGLAVNLYARILDRPAQVVLVPAMILLVPGSVGFRGMSSLLDRDTLTGVETTFAMFVVAIAIVAGLLVANATVSPRRHL